MLKKIMIIMATVLLFFGGSVWAMDGNGPETLLTPPNPSYNAAKAIENAQYELATDLEEKIMIQDEHSKRRLMAIKNAGDFEDFNELLAAYAEHEQELGERLEELEGPNAEEIFGLVKESSEQKSVRLTEILEDENLPEVAREGVAKALENQEMAMDKLEEALDRAQEAHEGARNRGNQENGETPGPPEDIDPGPPADKTPGPPEGVEQGPPDDIPPGPTGDIDKGPSGNKNAPAGAGAPGGGGRP